jgi:UDP-glucose 4-epimerase
VRNWTYIGDIVDGTILAAEKIDDATAVNLGTMERVTVLNAVKLVMEYSGHRAKIAFRADMPVGPLNRVADNSLAKRLLGWQPKMKFADGLRRTLEWYFTHKEREEICRTLARRLTER